MNEQVLARDRRQAPPDRIAFLRRSLCLNPLFAELSDTTLDHIARVARLIVYEDGERVVVRGDEIRHTLVILSGGIRTSTTSSDGYELSVSILHRGACHGVMGVPEPTPCSWDCYAVGRTEVVALTCADFRAALPSHPDLGLMLAKMLNYRLKKAYLIMSSVTLQDLETRLRRTLVMLAGGMTQQGDAPAEITITQEALGHFVQCTRPTINKALKDLERLGLVEVGYGHIRILDMKKLQTGIESEVLYVL